MKLNANILACLICSLIALSGTQANGSVTNGETGRTLKVGQPFKDNMVLQCDKPVRIWGTAEPSETVAIDFNGTSVSATCDNEGRWSAVLPAMPCSKKGRTMTIRTEEERIVISNILMGDVWIAAGQSNMLMRVRSLDKEDAAELRMIKDKSFRYYQIPVIVEGGKVKERKEPEWVSFGDTGIDSWSAVAIYFALRLREKTDRPIGIICAAQGSSTIESWLERDYCLRNDVERHFQKRFGEERIESRYRNPYVLFDSMLSPIVGFTAKGVAWYQGEANAKTGIAAGYGPMQEALIKGWREAWKDESMAFGVVQLPSYGYKETKGSADQSWAILRQCQKDICDKVSGTAMAVCMDLGEEDNIHPKAKKEVGRRLAYEVLNRFYGMTKLPVSPRWGEVRTEGERLIITLEGRHPLRPGQSVSGFEVMYEGRGWESAEAWTEKRSVSLSINGKERIKAIRYAWKNCGELSIRNTKGFPASPMIIRFQD